MRLHTAKRPPAIALALLGACVVLLVLSACAPLIQPVAPPSAAPAPIAAATADEALRERTQAEVPTLLATLESLVGSDEEIGSPGSSAFITQLGSEYDAVFSFEGGASTAATGGDMLRLATSSTAGVEMKVIGKASHAGSAPHLGRNAIYELAHQMLKSRNFGDPAKGLQINWTIASGGGVSNVIPAEARAIGDVRSLNERDLDLTSAAAASVGRRGADWRRRSCGAADRLA